MSSRAPDSTTQDAPSPARSTEAAPVVLGERSGAAAPAVRLLPGRVEASRVLYPGYLLVWVGASLASLFAWRRAEWHPLMVFVGWGGLFCWYWVYGVAYRYRRRLMKVLAVGMSALVGAVLIWVSATRAAPMRVPVDGVLVERGALLLPGLAAVATTLSLALLIAHLLYFGRGYREKRERDSVERPR
ncbi:hypothetical protein FRC96_01655 [Lujinxingia vulgaris]|uniref:Uncharacterized protein n=1 Tax=Lujinxingia vulgaris TaxID=2600176 RepID=A0A5C6XJ57_9DELT|nr:hypothetical protein [Lujinxingia vulgaris]TXD43495.1 hypothetical protein FRC96_01655 [Lujinxingia vulgaris]